MAELVLDILLAEGPKDLPTVCATPSDPQSSTPATDHATRGRLLLESSLDLVDHKLRHLSRCSGLPEHEAEEFRSWALLKLVEDDYRVLARWEGRSSFSTYLNVVLVNLLRDFRVHLWGKWRPSAAARRRGQESVLLERLLVRDGLRLDEAIQRIQTEKRSTLTRTELEEIADQLPRRQRRWRLGEEEMLGIPIDGQVERRVEDGERSHTASRVRESLPPLLRSLSTEERLLLKLHYWEGSSIAKISTRLGRAQRELYSLRDRCLKKLRRGLESAGLSAEQVREILGGTH